MDDKYKVDRFKRNQIDKEGRLILSELPKGKVNLVLPMECVDDKDGTINLKQLIKFLQDKNGEEIIVEYTMKNMKILEVIKKTKETHVIMD